MTENIPPPYVDTECKGCKTKDKPLFPRALMRDKKDYFCKDCMEQKKHL